MEALAEAEPGEQGGGAFTARLRRLAGIDRGHFRIAQRRQLAQQVIALEDKAEMLAPQRRQRIVIQRGNRPAGNAVFAGARLIQAAENVHQRRFAGAGLPDDGDELA